MQNLRSRVLVSALETGLIPAMRQRPVFVRTVADDQYEIDEYYYEYDVNWPPSYFSDDVDDDCEAAWYDYEDGHFVTPAYEYEPNPEAVPTCETTSGVIIDLRAADEHLLDKDRQSRRRHDTVRHHRRFQSRYTAISGGFYDEAWYHLYRISLDPFKRDYGPTTRALRERCALKADLADLVAPIK